MSTKTSDFIRPRDGRRLRRVLGYAWTERRWYLPRRWSNDELWKFGQHISGKSVVNVSGWKDQDKEGGKYRNYFPNSSEYAITNWGNGEKGAHDEGNIAVDLESTLAPGLVDRFDVVFNHTTLEHVFDIFTAFSNLCKLSRDLVIVVVPMMQETHFDSDFKDYWRFSPFTLRRLFEREGLQVIYENNSPWEENATMYLFYVASKKATEWSQILPHHRLEDRFFGHNVVRNDPLAQISSLLYGIFKRFGWYRSWEARIQSRYRDLSS